MKFAILILITLSLSSFGVLADKIDICYYQGVVVEVPSEVDTKPKFIFLVMSTLQPTASQKICKETIGEKIEVSIDTKESDSIELNDNLQVFVFYKNGKNPIHMGIIENE